MGRHLNLGSFEEYTGYLILAPRVQLVLIS